MKRLLTMVVVLAVLAVCAPSNAYILIYKLSSTIKVVDTDANSMMNVRVSGYLALSLDDADETVDEAQMVIYGKNADANKIYYIEDFHGNTEVVWEEQGEYVTVNISNYRDPFYYDLRFTGKIKEKDVGFGLDDLRSAAGSLKGSMLSTEGSLFDLSQILFGSGSASMTLDMKKTKASNDVTPPTLDEIITDIVAGDGGLIEKGYEELIIL